MTILKGLTLKVTPTERFPEQEVLSASPTEKSPQKTIVDKMKLALADKIKGKKDAPKEETKAVSLADRIKGKKDAPKDETKAAAGSFLTSE